MHPVIRTQEDIRNTKLHRSGAAPRQVHLQGRDQHQLGVGDRYGGSQIGKLKDNGEKLSPARWRDKLASSKGRAWEGMTLRRR